MDSISTLRPNSLGNTGLICLLSKPWANMSKPFNFVAHLLYTGPEKNIIKNCWKNEWFVFCDVFSKPPRKACYKSKIAWFTLITCLSWRFRKNNTKDKLLLFSTILNEFIFGGPVYKRCATKLDGLLMLAHGLLVCSIDISTLDSLITIVTIEKSAY